MPKQSKRSIFVRVTVGVGGGNVPIYGIMPVAIPVDEPGEFSQKDSRQWHFSHRFLTITKRDVTDSWKTVAQINAQRQQMAALDDAQLREKTAEFKQRIASGATLDELLPEAFAVVREAAMARAGSPSVSLLAAQTGRGRSWATSALDELIVTEIERDATEARLRGEGRRIEAIERYMEPFDVQMIGGIILHKGMIAEMRTGEGKTLVAAAPLYLNALSSRSVMLVTVNDYLVRYQGTLMGELYHFLGLTTAITQAGRGGPELPAFMYEPGYSEPDGMPDLRPVHRREAYRADIMYATNNEVGFDYLRDNMAWDVEQLMQRDLHYVIIDEVDNILVDEARTPVDHFRPRR